MLLSELQPKFLKLETTDNFRCKDVSMTDADGLWFLCPKCFKEKGGPKGTHSIICWEPSVPQDTIPTGGRWMMEGTGFDDLSLVAGTSSVFLKGGCKAHFFVRNGKIEMC